MGEQGKRGAWGTALHRLTQQTAQTLNRGVWGAHTHTYGEQPPSPMAPGSRGSRAPTPTPHPRPLARSGSNRQTRRHIWKACPPGRLAGPHIWKYLLPSVGMEARQPLGRKGRRGGQSLHYVSGLQMCADVATRPAAAGLDGAQGPGEPRNETSSPLPRPLAAAWPSRSLPPSPPLPLPGVGPFRGAGGEGEPRAVAQAMDGLGGWQSPLPGGLSPR